MNSLLLNTAAEQMANVSATGLAEYAWLMVAIPLLSSAFLLVCGRSTDKWGHWLAVAASWSSFLIGFIIFCQMIGQAPAERSILAPVFTWFKAGGGNETIELSWNLLLDPLSMTFVLLVTFVGSLIHVYSVAYMEHDPDRRRFFAYLNFFVASMLTLVLSDSYVALFFGWEGVGLASYLLIGFWNHELANAVAAKKAFVMNRVGDLGLLLAMMAMYAEFNSMKFVDVLGASRSGDMTGGWATAIGLFLLLAACGKSAQFPLQAWLGDAMAGPTPVSALIHAATMVTAGVYLIVRSGDIFVASPTAQLCVAIVGAITLLFGAIVGCAKDDMKKVLAASTMSQIGYMMLGAGLGPIGWTLAIFHLFVHGFFKAQLFLGAGSVMHAMNEQVDMRRFGGLRTVMKVSWICFGIAWLAILGIPPFSGFFSKEPIIAAAFNSAAFGTTGAWIFGLIAMVGAGITSFYMSRLFFMIFHGEKRWTTEFDGGSDVHPHEASWLMNGPIVVLSVFSLAMGMVLGFTDKFTQWLVPVTGTAAATENASVSVLSHAAISVITLILVLCGLALAFVMYVRKPVPKVAPASNALVTAARVDLYQDTVNESVAMLPAQLLTVGVGGADRGLIDGIVRGIAWCAGALGRALSHVQNGYIRAYASYILGGVLVALVLVVGSQLV
ncbi:NADH-quinone oxidoreductase subunit L [Varibaculum cambriense]|uniref:NADH-quinone oxidoreductase subunit L n=1 Tax=Varibaculum cambriense TaxID=184870 RepID=UPI00290266E9|nr:NADH-quinone oxidoreductase subunit L [Varibaculum cambriense]MDU1683451.1 NADH-quinone oxidoreductase subunit L [Varibaculum cambriense]